MLECQHAKIEGYRPNRHPAEAFISVARLFTGRRPAGHQCYFFILRGQSAVRHCQDFQWILRQFLWPQGNRYQSDPPDFNRRRSGGGLSGQILEYRRREPAADGGDFRHLGGSELGAAPAVADYCAPDVSGRVCGRRYLGIDTGNSEDQIFDQRSHHPP